MFSSKQLDTERDDSRTASKLRLRLEKEKETLLAEDDMLDTPAQANTVASSNSNTSMLSAEDRETRGKTENVVQPNLNSLNIDYPSLSVITRHALNNIIIILLNNSDGHTVV